MQVSPIHMHWNRAMHQKIEASLSALVRPASLSVERKLPAASAECHKPLAPIRTTDSLRLTGEAAGLQALQRELAQAPAVDMAKVEAVREELASGTYRINPEKIAERMLELDRQLGA